MKKSPFSTIAVSLIAVIGLAGTAFAEKIGVVPSGDGLHEAIAEVLAGSGHEIVEVTDVPEKLDAVAAAAMGKATGAQIIVTAKKIGPVVVIKVLSTKNDTVVGGSPPPGSDGAAIGEAVKKIIEDNKAKIMM